MSDGYQERYLDIADDLRRKITSGLLPAKTKLPTLVALAAEYDVARGTVQSALRQLTEEGFVYTVDRVGTFVRSYDVLEFPWTSWEGQRKDTHEADAWATSIQEQGREPSVEVTVEITTAPPRIAVLLQITEDAIVVARHRLRQVDKVPFVLQTSYFPEELVRGTRLMLPGDQSGPQGLLSEAGLVQVRHVDRIQARMPTRQEADQLNLVGATAVAEHIRTGYDADHRPLRSMVSILPGDRNIMVYDLTAGA